MSTGEIPPSGTTRFTSPSGTLSNTNTKKYTGTPKSPMLNTTTIGNRNSQTRQRLLAGKISAPRPMNLPSLRREHAVGTEVPASSPSTSHGWGSSTSSPSLAQTPEINKPMEQNTITSPIIKPAEPTVDSTSKVDPASSPPPNNTQTSTVRAWAVPTVSKPSTQPPATDFPTAAEAAAKKTSLLYDDKEYLKYASSDPNHTSWDEMVSEDLDDFQVDVVEFDDGTKVQVDGNEESINPVSPSDRFTEDYDRSYPPRHHNEPSDQGYNKSTYRRSEDHNYSSRYNNSYDNRRHSTVTNTTSSTEERRTSTTTTDRWTRRDSLDNNRVNSNRRSSYDRKSSTGHPPVYNNNNSNPPTSSVYHPTLLQRPRRLSEQSFRSDHSREEHINPLQIITEPAENAQPNEIAEITAAQREVMLTAAERAKKRRDEEEAEFEAARIRARQKADALARLAEEAKKDSDSKKEIEMKKGLEGKKESEIKKEPEVKKSSDSKKESDTKKEIEVKKEVSIEKKPIVVNLEKKSPKSSLPVEKKETNDKKKTSSQSPPPSVPVKILSPPLPDTSKPWNLVAAKKEPTIMKKPTPATTNKPTKSETAEKKESTEHTSELPKKEEFVPPTVDKNGKPLSKDEQNWEIFVSKMKTDTTIPKAEATSNDWNSFAVRLQQSVIDNQAEFNAKHKAANADKIVEVIDYTQNEDWGTIPSHITQGRSHDRGWTRNDEEHGGHSRNNYNIRGRGSADRGGRGGRGGRGRGVGTMHRGISSNTHYNQNQFDNSNDYWRQHTDNDEQKQPIVTEILKHEPVVEKPEIEKKPDTSVNTNTVASKKTRLTNLLKESNSPIFPNFIEKLAGKKPANMSFMVDTDESDKDITMMDQIIVTESKVIEEPQVINKPTDKTQSEPVETSVPTSDVDKNTLETDEMSATSSTTSTPPRTQFQHNDNTKNDSISRKMNINSNYPVLVYQYPLSQQPQNTEDTRFKGAQQRPAGVYLMPQQQYVTGNQYLMSYPPAGTGVQPVFYPALPWQQPSQPQYNSATSPRPHYEQRRTYNNNFKPTHHNSSSEWESLANSSGYQSHRYNNTSSYQRGNSYRKRGGWSNTTSSRGRGNHAYQPRRYPDSSPSQPLTPTSTENL